MKFNPPRTRPQVTQAHASETATGHRTHRILPDHLSARAVTFQQIIDPGQAPEDRTAAGIRPPTITANNAQFPAYGLRLPATTAHQAAIDFEPPMILIDCATLWYLRKSVFYSYISAKPMPTGPN